MILIFENAAANIINPGRSNITVMVTRRIMIKKNDHLLSGDSRHIEYAISLKCSFSLRESA